MEFENARIGDELNKLKSLLTAWVKELLRGLKSNEANASSSMEAANSALTGEILRLLHSKNLDTSGLESAASNLPIFNLDSQEGVAQALQVMNDEIKKIMANSEVRIWITELRNYYQRILQSSTELIQLNCEIDEKLFAQHSGFINLRTLLIRFWTLFLEAEEKILSQSSLPNDADDPMDDSDLEAPYEASFEEDNETNEVQPRPTEEKQAGSDDDETASNDN